MKIDSKTRLSVYFKDRDLAPYRKYLMYHHEMEFFLMHNRLEMMLKRAGWNKESIENGLTLLEDAAKSRKQFCYRIYEDPKKADALIMRFPVKEKTPFVVVCSGGAYSSVCNMSEALPVCFELNRLGYNAFLVNYRVGKGIRMPVPVDDLAEAVRFILNHSEEFHIEKDYIVTGFSAGANLINTFCSDKLGYSKYGLPAPRCAWPVYGTVSDDFEKDKTKKNHYLISRFGKDFSTQIFDDYDILKNAKAYPPAYIVHAKDDPVVSYRQSVELDGKLTELNTPHMLELGEFGGHGFGTGKGTDCEGWIERAIAFYEEEISKG